MDTLHKGEIDDDDDNNNSNNKSNNPLSRRTVGAPSSPQPHCSPSNYVAGHTTPFQIIPLM
jgi:hypothetical protein